jgi:hypothetical protein
MIPRIALLLISIPLLVHGGDALYLAARSRTQARLTCGEYAVTRPRSGWVRLGSCEVDYVRAGYRETGGRLTELLFPLRPLGSSPAMPAAVVLATRDPAILQIAERAIRGSAEGRDDEAFTVSMLQIVNTMRGSRDIEGLARTPLQAFRTRPSITAIHAPLADDFVVIDLGAQPRLLVPAIEAAAGGNALLVLLFLSIRARRRVRNGAELPSDPVAAVAPPASLRGMMLLNLPEFAGAVDIDGAPPLGEQDEVRARLASILPGLTFDGRGRATFTRPDVTATVDLSTATPVHTAVISLEGEAADDTLRRVLSKTGWRAFSPKRGAFVPPAAEAYASVTTSRVEMRLLPSSATASLATASSIEAGDRLEKHKRSSDSPAGSG